MKIRYLVPTRIKKILKYTFYSLVDFIRFVRRKKSIYPPRRLNFVGSAEFEKVGHEFFHLFKEYGHLKSSDDVLDIGSGIGRMAIPMTDFLDSGTYEGFDIDWRGVDWCQKNLTPKFPNFHFQYADIFNAYYNKKGRIHSSEFSFPYEDDRFDFIFATSVFTHMLTQDVEHYLEEIHRVARKGAKIFLTFFLLNEESLKNMGTTRSNCHFGFQHDEVCFYSHKEVQEAELAFKEEFVMSALKKAGLGTKVSVNYGTWSGREDGLSYQDIVIIHKT